MQGSQIMTSSKYLPVETAVLVLKPSIQLLEIPKKGRRKKEKYRTTS